MQKKPWKAAVFLTENLHLALSLWKLKMFGDIEINLLRCKLKNNKESMRLSPPAGKKAKIIHDLYFFVSTDPYEYPHPILSTLGLADAI